jgi:hypothetical protein
MSLMTEIQYTWMRGDSDHVLNTSGCPATGRSQSATLAHLGHAVPTTHSHSPMHSYRVAALRNPCSFSGTGDDFLEEGLLGFKRMV